MKELDLTIICDIKKYRNFPRFSRSDLPEHIMVSFSDLPIKAERNKKNQITLVITDSTDLVRSTLNRNETWIYVIFVGEYDAIKKYADRLEDIWPPCDETELILSRLQWTVRRMREYLYSDYYNKYIGDTDL